MTKPDINVLEQRIKELEDHYIDIEEKLDTIRTNHLPHIQAEISSLRTEIRVWAGLNVSAIIVGLLVVKLFNI